MKPAIWSGLLAGWLLLPSGAALAQQCQTTGTNQTCSNAIALSGGVTGLQDGGTATVTNASGGSITGVDAAGTGSGINAVQNANVINFGTISATGLQALGVAAGGEARVTNFGSITATALGTGASAGIKANVSVTVQNAGTIAAYSGLGGAGGTAAGIYVGGRSTIVNSGTIIAGTGTGGFGLGIHAYNGADVINSGTIFGSMQALTIEGTDNSLTVLPGSRLIGVLYLGDSYTVNFRGGNHNLTFSFANAAQTVTGTTPFAVSGKHAVAIDPTSFAANGHTLNDFSRGVFDAVPVFSGTGAPGGGPLAFAAPEASSRVDDAFASLPGLSAYAKTDIAYKNPTVVYGDGSAVWARGFGGQRIQQQDGVLLRTANQFYGGMIGGDWQTRPDLRFGAFLGGGQTRSSIDLNQGNTNADLVFGGAYARYDFGSYFLHAAVQGGSSRNTTTRTINNNLVAGGLETAAASYDGWYVSPEATVGQRWALGSLAGANYTLTPSLRLRYLYGSYAGYTETGTTAPLTLTGQTVNTLEERGEAKLTRSVAFAPNDVLSTSITAGVLGTQRVGSNTVNAALLGQAIPFATPGQSNVWGGFGGLGLEWQTRNVTLFSAGEYLALSDRSNVVSGRAGLRVAF